ncbi:MAG: DUF4296 domain-containing protein [Lentimicrobiaceae bacterium]|nr:DUF4296 domain-containing protein [Lentimicrobiaceae bacterium]
MNKISFLKLIFLLLVGFCACGSFTKNKPAPLLPIDSVATLIADCYFLEGEIYVQQWRYDTKNYASVKYDSLFATRGITKETLVQNVRYYFSHKKHAEKIMGKVDEIVEQRVAALKDSLNNEP